MADLDDDSQGANPPDRETVLPRAQRCAQAAGVVVATMGAVALIGGYWLGAASLRSIMPGWPPLRVASAIMCLLDGLSLALLAATPLSRWRRLVGLIGAAAAGLVAGLTLIEHASDRDLGIDHLVYRGNPGIYGPFAPRVPLQSVTSFLLLSGALALLPARGARARRLVDVLALAGGAIGAAAVMGFVHRNPVLYQLPARGLPWGMALEAAVAIVLLAFGTLCASPASGLASVVTSPEAGGFMARRLLMIVALVFPAIAVVAEAGWWAGLYTDHTASAIVLLSGIAAGALGILVTAKRLNETSADLRRALHDAMQWKHFFRRASWGVVIAAPDGRLLCANTAYARMHGSASAQLVGAPLAELFAKEERALLPERMRAAGERGQQVFDSRHVREDGSAFPVLVDMTAVADERGRILHFALYVQDLTESEGMRRELRAAGEATRKLVERIDAATRAHLAISDAALSLPSKGRHHLFEVIVQQARELTSARYGAIGFGVDPERPFDPWIQSGISPELAAVIGRPPRPVGTLRAAARGDIVRVRDVRAHPEFRDLPPHHPELSSFLGVPILDRGRRVGSLYLANKQGAEEFTAEDQTLAEMLAARASAALETARLYEAEVRERGWLETALEQVPEAILLVDAGGKIILENGAFRALHRREHPPDTGDDFTSLDLRFPDGRPVPAEERPLYRALVLGEQVGGVELAVRRPDGEMIPILASATPVQIGGEVLGAAAVGRDIRTLKELERLREEWAALVAHDLRQPVGVLALAVESFASARARDLGDPERKAIERMRRAIGGLRTMIGDLLDASLLEAKHLEIVPAAVDLDGVVREVLDSMPELVGHAVRCRPPCWARVWADRARVEQILRNLLSNAVKYGRPGTEIGIDIEAHDGWVETSIANRGQGIEPDELAKLFQRFKRTAAGRASGATGIGLGLYVTKGLVEAQGGRIWIDSTPGETTIVHFTLPVPVAAAA